MQQCNNATMHLFSKIHVRAGVFLKPDALLHCCIDLWAIIVLRYVKNIFVFCATRHAYPFGKGSARVNKWQGEDGVDFVKYF
jgi:hypothetical protein